MIIPSFRIAGDLALPRGHVRPASPRHHTRRTYAAQWARFAAGIDRSLIPYYHGGHARR